MIIIINGPLGVGKTETAWALLEHFEKGVMLDGDYIGAVWPFDLHDEARLTYLYETLAHLIAWHRQHGYANFVINYVFESAAELTQLRHLLAVYDSDIYAFRLTAANSEIEQRVRRRGNMGLEWELHRFLELSVIQEAAAQQGDLGTVIDTTSLSVSQTAEMIAAWLWDWEKVQLVEYNPAWPPIYAQEAARVREALGGMALDVQHIGSTAVPGLTAKPIIDLMVVASMLEAGRQYDELLRPLGYSSPNLADEVNHRFFVRGLPRRFHLHIYPAGSAEIKRHLTFRNALRASDELRMQYSVLKRELTLQHNYDREAYTEAKTDFVNRAVA